MDKVYQKIESYLRKEFPGRKLFRYILLKNKGAEIYGFGKMQIKVVLPNETDLFYQLIKSK